MYVHDHDDGIMDGSFRAKFIQTRRLDNDENKPCVASKYAWLFVCYASTITGLYKKSFPIKLIC